ncbi:MAG: ribose 5-phosphate isomerase B [Bacteroidota bacterium]
MNETIAIACDHAGFELKTRIAEHLQELGFEVKDFGSYTPEAVDYPDFAHPMADAVDRGIYKRGITLCGSGNGINMVANKHQHVRAALCWTPEIAEMARKHNDANICSLPSRYISVETARQIVDVFLNTGFDGGRHQKRIDKIPVNTGK